MSTGKCCPHVRKVVKGIVDKIAKEFEEHDKLLAESNKSFDTNEQQGDGDVRRSVRPRKEPDRLAAKPQVVAKQPRKPKKEEPVFNFELVMAPVPADLRGILKADRPYPPPRKSSLSATAGKIVKKYRKVRVCRRLHFKVITPLPGWRPDRTRMPEDEPDEEEQRRLEEQQATDAAAAAEALKKKRKRKSVGPTPASATVSDDGGMDGSDESSTVDIATPGSPDVFYEDFMKEDSPDSVLTTDHEEDAERREERRKPVNKSLFPPIKEGSNEDDRRVDAASSSSKDTVVGGEDTVAATRKEDTVASEVTLAAKDPVDAKKKPERRRSVRIQPPPEEEKPKAAAAAAAEKKERRKSKMFPVTPMKESPAPKEKEKKPAVEKKEKSLRRSGVIRSLLNKKTAEEEGKARFPWTDVPSKPADKEARLGVIKASKAAAWLARDDTAATAAAEAPADPAADAAEVAAAPAAAAGGDGAAAVGKEGGEILAALRDQPSGSGSSKRPDEMIEAVRGADSREALLSEKSSSNSREKLVEAAKPEQARRKGRRSMYVKAPKEDIESSSASEMEEKKEKKEKSQQLHPFFAKNAPKPEATGATVHVPVLFEKKKQNNRRRSMFVPKKQAAAAAKKDDEEGTEEDDDVVEIVGEVTKKKEKEGGGEAPQPGDAHSFWRSSEIDAAPYEGLVHVGRDKESSSGSDGGSEDEVMVKKMRRLSVQLPRLSSHAVPASVRGCEQAAAKPAEQVPVWDEERKASRSERAAALFDRARGLAAAAADAATCSWPEAMRPRRVEECMGDQELLASGKRWLQKWKKRLDAVCAEEEKATTEPKAKRKKRKGGAYSDESEQEDSDSDYELRDEEQHRLPNPLVLSGPVGCGKTAYIRALSEEVGFALLESGPDERRAGSSLRTKLIGAVGNYRMSSKPSIASFFSAAKNGGENGSGEKNGEKKKKGEGEERKERQHTMVVIEHVDVVFTEEDKLFWPALAEILATTKIPIVLTCNVVPDELQRVLQQAEEAGGEHMEIAMERGESREVEEYVEATLAGSTGRALSATVIPAIVARARGDLRAALHDTHWAAAAATLSQADLADSRMRRVDEPAMCDTVAGQSFAWSDECARRAEKISSASELSRAAEWPARCGMPGETYARLCKQIDEIDEDAYRVATARAERMMEMARSGVGAGSGGRSGLLTRREIATDWMPILEQMDMREQEKKRTNGRRHQHYFNVIKDLNTGVSIDPLDRIQGACAFFRLPQ